uniref:LysM domain-containing protein n=1 Tax=Oryza barthii TaxID=65489 RepID=A0A0D3FCU4_9ORYZ
MGVPSAPAPDAHRRGVFLLSVGAGGGGAGTAVVEVEVEHPHSLSLSPPPMSSCGRYILHRVCRFDTLAGVAIKYGVEVADVKRVNGLSTDLQMFAHKTLRIPLPGRHPPAATATATATATTPSHPPPSSSPAATHRPREWATRRPPKNSALDPLLKPPRSTVAPSMDLLQNYYGLARPPKGDPENEGTEMATYSIGQHTKARSLSTGFSLVNGEVDDAEKPIRRRQKSDAEFSTREGNSGGVLMKAGPGLALRPKSGSRPEINNSQQDLVATAVPSYGDGLQAVRKSSSTPEFQDSDNSIASVWLKSKWNLKPDAFTLPLPILLLDSIPKPIFDTFPKQIAAWRNKAARD